jgi:hypothetical protein
VKRGVQGRAAPLRAGALLMATGLQPGGANGWPRLRTLAPAPRESRFAESVIPVADSAPKRYSTLTRRTALERGTKPMKRTPLRWKPRTHEYGGASEDHPTYRHFRDTIRLRDRGECRACAILRHHRRDGTELAHLLWRVQGKRTTSTVNFAWNAVWACYEHARETDTSKAVCAALVRALVKQHSYVLPERAQWEVERWAEPAEETEFEPRLSIVDGRAVG